MSSIHSNLNQMPANVLYVATATITTLYDASGVALSGGALALIATASGTIYRDMGKMVSNANGVFRKVQQVPAGAAVAGADGDNYLTCYIKLGVTGATGATPVARMC